MRAKSKTNQANDVIGLFVLPKSSKMNTSDKLKVESYQETARVLVANQIIYESDIATKDLTGVFNKDLTAIVACAEKMDQPTSWLTREKSETKQQLLAKLHPFSVILVRFANSKDDEKILDEVKITKGRLKLMNETNLLIYTNKCIEIARANLTELANFSITEETITELDADSKAFQQKRSQRLLLIDDKKDAKKEFAMLKKRINLLLRDELDWSIESYREAQPDFVSHYFAARQTAKAPHRSYDVLGYLTDAATGESISLGSVTVEGLDLSVKITVNGTFRFKSFPEGEYRLKIENMNYKTLYIPIRRYASERSKLHLKMVAMPLEVLEPAI